MEKEKPSLWTLSSRSGSVAQVCLSYDPVANLSSYLLKFRSLKPDAVPPRLDTRDVSNIFTYRLFCGLKIVVRVVTSKHLDQLIFLATDNCFIVSSQQKPERTGSYKLKPMQRNRKKWF